MSGPSALVAGAAWSGLARGASGEVRFGSPRRSGRRALDLDGSEDLAKLFPGRWNPRRALPGGLERLVEAFALALREAGWWEPGMAEPVRGSLILGSDSHAVEAAAAFARELAEEGPAGISPGGFLFALPSSPTAVLGILFGLREYQATVVEGGRSGLKAVAHALDLLALGRVERVAAGAFSVVRGGLAREIVEGPLDPTLDEVDEIELAVALCLELPSMDPAARAGLPAIDESCILMGAKKGTRGQWIHPAHRGLGAAALLAVAEGLCGGREPPPPGV